MAKNNRREVQISPRRNILAGEAMFPSAAGTPIAEQPQVNSSVAVPGTLLGKMAAEEKPDLVIVTVPKRFQLRLDHHTLLVLQAGVQKLERSVAENWYAKANGVKVFNPDSDKE